MDTERITENPWGLEPLLDVGEFAAYLGVPVSTVYDWRTRGLGPRAYRFGKHLKFALSDGADLDRAAARPRAASVGGRAVSR
ncbi:helix-turn-helix domain-containing protein [Arthrobacter woluwensis]|uniref:helix-turn-helix domain-containing protein n=1 Tax=Arthrobacter woluwensis TaxID=156980 RepID=UPI0027D77669|nr:helix-turn-helix domain-containing protein [Arthrobacter woluwensis]